jgi:hypothetical protein
MPWSGALQNEFGDAGRFGSFLVFADAAPWLTDNWARFAKVARQTKHDNDGFLNQVTHINNTFQPIQ